MKVAYPINEACEQAGISRSQIYKDHKNGKIAFRKLGTRTLITHEELMRYINALPVDERSQEVSL